MRNITSFLEQKAKMNNKGVMGQVVSVFILTLVIAVIVGMTFLFTAQLKTQITSTASDQINSTAYQAVNKTEAAGYTLVSYIPLVFIAIIFGVILVVVLKVVLPFMNVGGSM